MSNMGWMIFALVGAALALGLVLALLAGGTKKRSPYEDDRA